MDVAAFGEPTDIDQNGKIAIVFTRAVNELTPRGSSSYVGGLTFSRDLFPQIGTPRASACPASNEGEFFYLMAPDPNGIINGNRRSNAFVDSNSTGVIAHELVHLINASRKLYVNTAAPKFEEKWLDEALAHEAEELLFYREAGLSPRSNITYQTLVRPRASGTRSGTTCQATRGGYATTSPLPPTDRHIAPATTLDARCGVVLAPLPRGSHEHLRRQYVVASREQHRRRRGQPAISVRRRRSVAA